jgi:hypothetical protein
LFIECLYAAGITGGYGLRPLSMILTAAIFVAEVVGGFWTGSLALLSDAAHALVGRD